MPIKTKTLRKIAFRFLGDAYHICKGVVMPPLLKQIILLFPLGALMKPKLPRHTQTLADLLRK